MAAAQQQKKNATQTKRTRRIGAVIV